VRIRLFWSKKLEIERKDMNRGIIVLTLFCLSLSSIYGAGQQEEKGKIRIVTTTGIVSDVLGEIAGDSVDQYRLIPAGHDPHTYEPTPHDMAMVEKADLIFVNGFDLEEGLLSIIENVHTGRIIEVSATVDPLRHEKSDSGDEEHHDVDPHTWMSPRNVLLWTDVVLQALTRADEPHAGVYRENAGRYLQKLTALDSWIRESLKVLPPEERILVTDHDVFGYFARDYGFKVAGTLLKGFSTAVEPTPREIADLIALLKRENIRAVFIGGSSGTGIKKLADTIGKESDTGFAVIELLTGSLKSPGQPGDTYIGMMKYNVSAIINGLTQ